MSKNSPLSLRAPAKINWFITVLGKRDDGYHEILSVMQSVGLYDELLMSNADTIEVVSDVAIPIEDNLVYRAAILLKRRTSYSKGAKIILRKKIPLSAGLGGGSSDGACTLLGLKKLWGLDLSNGELSSIGAEVGSDVPFFLNGPTAFVEGRGERVTPLEVNSSITFLLVKPPVFVSTAWVYDCFDRLYISGLTRKSFDIKLFCEALKERDFALLSTMVHNDLEWVVIERYPEVGEMKERLLEKGAVVSAMSGSGPTVFGVFESRQKALSAASEMGSHWCNVVKTII